MDKQTIQRRINKVRQAYNNCKVDSITFNKDGSGAEVIYTDPTGDHGLPCLVSSSFNIEDAIKIVSGMRLKIGDIPTTLQINEPG